MNRDDELLTLPRRVRVTDQTDLAIRVNRNPDKAAARKERGLVHIELLEPCVVVVDDDDGRRRPAPDVRDWHAPTGPGSEETCVQTIAAAAHLVCAATR